jgi:antitoxin component YwqK of YwqJK toxin-antitoxin module
LYQKEKNNGTWTRWDESGNKIFEGNYKDEELIYYFLCFLYNSVLEMKEFKGITILIKYSLNLLNN